MASTYLSCVTAGDSVSPLVKSYAVAVQAANNILMMTSLPFQGDIFVEILLGSEKSVALASRGNCGHVVQD